MYIMPINNINTQNTPIKAKFRKQDINEFLKEATVGEADMIPELYTMLNFIKNLPGECAKIDHIGLWYRILIDGKSINGTNKYFCASHALMDATVEHKNTILKDSPVKRMSEEEFESAYCKNSKKTINDIKNLDSYI